MARHTYLTARQARQRHGRALAQGFGLLAHILRAQQKSVLVNEQLLLMQQKRQLTQLQIAQLSNKVLLQDLEIEEKKRKLGINDNNEFDSLKPMS